MVPFAVFEAESPIPPDKGVYLSSYIELGDLDLSGEVTMEDFLELEEWLEDLDQNSKQKLDDQNTLGKGLEISPKTDDIDRHKPYEIDRQQPYLVGLHPPYAIN
ncbi:hypothetical protein Bca52824_011330 [Brassica carinata]|uniref:Uncharacterized protein n=1 Tax=Brassica carinata TaxID=52824 RepID=A0A8X8BC45_BRACI|nr:hypothetical protein Bca52824_011330 [Brassica carinata]